MKRIISTFAILLVLAFGCTDQINITSPEQPAQIQNPNWIALPQQDGFGIEQSFSISKNIDGDEGGSIILSKSYISSSENTVTIYSKAYFPENAFIGTRFVTMSVDDATCTVTFSPSMVFSKPVVYNVTYTGIDLSNINPATVKFAYLAPDGTVQYPSHSGILVDQSTGTLRVNNAKIPHFSRYGFVN